MTIPQYVLMVEGEEIKDYLLDAYNTMCNCIKTGLSKTGKLPGSLGVERKANSIYNKAIRDASMLLQQKVFAYAYAVIKKL